MKRKLVTLLTCVLTLALASCGTRTQTSVPENPDTSTSQAENSLNSATSTSSSKDSVGSSIKPNSNATPKEGKVTVFSINDVHGSLEMDEDNSELGLARLDYAIRHDPDYDPETSILISCGDVWQGGYLAHEDPSLVSTLLHEMDVSAFVIGNHEFDWGIDTLSQLAAQSDFPFLGCNIFSDKAETTKGDWYTSSTIVEKGGIKYGIIGGIGPEEETAISVSALGDYSFSDNVMLFDAEYQALEAQGCDLIFLALHAGDSDSLVTTLGSRYQPTMVSGIFGAHTHSFDNEIIGNLPFVQGGCNSKGYAKMTFDLSTKLASKKSYRNCSYSFDSYASLLDSDLNQNMVTAIYDSDLAHDGSITLATFNGEFRKGKELNKFVPDAMLSTADKYGWGSNHGGKELIAIHNSAGIRSNLPSGPITEKILFKFCPFDNKVKVIQNVTGSQISKLIGTVNDAHSSSYYVFSTQSGNAFDSNKTYDVVTIDFVSEGNYFSHITGTQYDLNKDENQVVYIRSVIEKFIRFPEGQVFNASDYYPY